MVRLKAGFDFGGVFFSLCFGSPLPQLKMCYFSLVEEPHEEEEKVQPCRLYMLVAVKTMMLYIILITHDIPKMQ